MTLKRYILLTAWVCGFIVEAFSSDQNDKGEIQVPDSILVSELEEVTITAERPATVLRADRISYFPSVMVSGGQGSIYEAIQALPGVTIDSDGEIKINGIQSLTLNIDGRKTILSGDNLINYLKTAPVSDIEKIEIVSSGGAKAEGADAVGILNLLKRRKKADSYIMGINMDGRLWTARQLYGSSFWDYCRNGHSISVNYSHYAARNPSELLTDRPYLDFQERLTQVYNRKRRDSSDHLSTAYEFRSDSGSIIGMSINYNYFIRKEPAIMTTSVPFASYPNVTSNNALFVTKNLFGEIYAKRQLTDTKNYWTAACDFFRYRSSENQQMEDNHGMSVDGGMIGNTFGVVGTFDFNSAVINNWHLSAGARCSYVNMKSEGRYYKDHNSQESNSISDETNNLDSSFGYNENVNAIYAEGNGDYGILNISVGIRTEQSNLNTYFSGNESSESRDISRKYFHVYPSLRLMFTVSSLGSWMLSYANRVTRPRFSDLDPFIHLFDDITHVGGNINLKEANHHSLSMVWSDNNRWRVVTGGEYISDDIVKYYRELSDRIVYVTPENIPSHIQWYLSASCSNISVSQWWNVSATANIIYSAYKFAKDTGLSRNALWTPVVDIRNVFRLPHQLSAEISASFRGRIPFGQAQTSSVWNTYVGFRKSFYNGKFSLSVYAKDIFNSNHFNSSIILSGRKAVLHEKEYENMRIIGISISWRMSGGVSTSKKEERHAWIDELNRVNL